MIRHLISGALAAAVLGCAQGAVAQIDPVARGLAASRAPSTLVAHQQLWRRLLAASDRAAISNPVDGGCAASVTVTANTTYNATSYPKYYYASMNKFWKLSGGNPYNNYGYNMTAKNGSGVGGSGLGTTLPIFEMMLQGTTAQIQLGNSSTPFSAQGGMPVNFATWGVSTAPGASLGGTVYLIRSIDGGATYLPITAAGVQLYTETSVASEDVSAEPSGTLYEVCAGSVPTSTINYRVR